MENKTQSNWAVQTRKNTLRLMLWTLFWTLSVALATFGPMFIWDYSKSLSIVAILLNLGLGAGLILANKAFLNGLDEMQKKIQLEAMALTLGVALVGGIAYTLLDTANIINKDAEISYLIILMSLTYMAGIVIGHLRYR